MAEILTRLQEILEKNGKSSTLQKGGDEAPDRLLVVLGTIEEGQEDVMEVTEAVPLFPDKPYHLLQFQYVLSGEVTADTFNQVSSVLHFFNRLIHCPGFELDELNNKVIYRYMWFVKDEGIDSFLVMQLLGNLRICYKMFSPYINEIAQGKYTLEEILKKVTQSKI